jgi:hypothetical protein
MNDATQIGVRLLAAVLALTLGVIAVTVAILLVKGTLA